MSATLTTVKPKVARAVWPNAGVRQRYRQRLISLIREMAGSVEYWVQAQRRSDPPELAEDALPSVEMRKAFRELAERWQGRFDDMAPKVAESFLKNQFRGTDAAMRQALRDAGWSIKFTLTPAMRDAFEASLAENVGLIRSIPAEYLQQVEGIVMRNYTSGRDLKSMAAEIRERFGVAANRAVLISRDQSNKANAVVQKARQQELGIEEFQWLHSHAGKEPRSTHLAMNGKRFPVSQGAWDSKEGAYVFPGELINCFPETSEVQFADFVSKAYRRFYCGELSEIVTKSGKTIRATPNHPILTPNGWIAIGRLKEGDDVFCVPDNRLRTEGLHTSSSAVSKENIDRAVPTFAEVFRSLAQSGNAAYSEVSHTANFHGDGRANGNVDVVFSARPLRFGMKPRTAKQFKQFALAVAYDTATILGSLGQFFSTAFNSSYRVMCGLGEPMSSLNTLPRHADTVSLTTPANLPTGSDNASNDRLAVDDVLFGEREHASAILMFDPQPERVIQINRVSYKGYVCNLETRHGFYLTGNIIAHNCRCVGRSVLPFTPSVSRASAEASSSRK